MFGGCYSHVIFCVFRKYFFLKITRNKLPELLMVTRVLYPLGGPISECQVKNNNFQEDNLNIIKDAFSLFLPTKINLHEVYSHWWSQEYHRTTYQRVSSLPFKCCPCLKKMIHENSGVGFKISQIIYNLSPGIKICKLLVISLVKRDLQASNC